MTERAWLKGSSINFGMWTLTAPHRELTSRGASDRLNGTSRLADPGCLALNTSTGPKLRIQFSDGQSVEQWLPCT